MASWRNQSSITGSNNIPLGNRRRFGAGGEREPDMMDSRSPAGSEATIVPDPRKAPKRGRSPVRDEEPLSADGSKPRKKRNRWAISGNNAAAGLVGLPTSIMANMTSEQLEAYVLNLRIEEISQKIRINDVVPADGDRSPSPPPQYDNNGRRVNTREYRYKKRLEDERHKLIEKAMNIIPDYHPPSDYRRPTKTQEKVYVPVNDYPEINFIGLLIGPRGNTLKKMEAESSAKIAIRGKGSVKEGKGRSDAAHSSNQEEDLHCLIMADTEDKVNRAKKAIHNVIETAASIPEGQNNLKRNQLRELAALNGTLRDDENQACQNCGEIGHRKYDCPQQRNFTNNIICRVCGNAGHMARDCPDRQPGHHYRKQDDQIGHESRGAIGYGGRDNEYTALMDELGDRPAGGPRQAIEAGPGDHGEANPQDEANLKPWQRTPTGAPAPWRNRDQNAGPAGSAPSYGNSGRNQNGYGGNQGTAPPWKGGRGHDSNYQGNRNGHHGGRGHGIYGNQQSNDPQGQGGHQGSGGYDQGYGSSNYGGYDQSYGNQQNASAGYGYGAQQGYDASAYNQYYNAQAYSGYAGGYGNYGQAGSAPQPPPPETAAPPPPPPPGDDVPPPPPPQ